MIGKPTVEQLRLMIKLYDYYYDVANPHNRLDFDNHVIVEEEALEILTLKQLRYIETLAKNDFNKNYDEYLSMIPEKDFV